MKAKHINGFCRFIVLTMGLVLNLQLVNAATISWINPAGGNWSNPVNWDAGTVPGSGDNAQIILGGSYTVSLDTNITVTTLTVGDSVGTPVVNWAASNLVVTNFTINSNATFNILAGALFNMAGTINNQGAINWGTTNKLIGLGDCTLNNFGLFNLQKNFVATNFSYTHGSGGFVGTFNNYGILQVLPGAGRVIFMPDYMYSTNSGTISAGTNSTLALQGLKIVYPDYTTHLSEWFNFNDGSLLTGAGTVQLTNCNLAATGTITDAGTFELALNAGMWGIHTWMGPGTFNWNGGSIGRALLFDLVTTPTNITVFSSNLQVNLYHNNILDNVTVNNQATILWNTGNLSAEDYAKPSVFNNNGTITVKGTMFFTGGFNVSSNCIFHNAGTIQVNSGYNYSFLCHDGWSFTNSGIFLIQTNATLDLEDFTNIVTFADGSMITGGGQLITGNGGSPCHLTANGTITVNGPTNAAGNFQIRQYGYLGGTQTWTGTGNMGLYNTTIYKSGTTTFSSNFSVIIGSQYNLPGNGILTIDAHLVNNQGTFFCNNCQFTDITNPCTFINSGILNVGGGLILGNTRSSGYVGIGSTFSNVGTITTGTSQYASIQGFWPFINSGIISIGTNTELNIFLKTAALTLTDGSRFTGSGSVYLQPDEYTTLQAPLNIFASGVITANSAIAMGSMANLQGTQTWTGSGSLNWNAGTMSGAGTTTIAPNFQFYILDDITNGIYSRSLTQNHVLSNQGNLAWNSSMPTLMSNKASFNNSGLMLLKTYSQLQQQTADCSFNNQSGGIMRVLGLSCSFNCPFTNSGTLDMNNTLGALTLSNAYALNASGVSQFEFGGPSAVLNVPALNLGGLLKVSLTNSYVVTNGSKITLANYTSHNGIFANAQLPSLPSTLAWQLDFGPTSLALEVVKPNAKISAPTMMAGGAFQFSLTGSLANKYFVEASSNLVDWVTLQTNSPFMGQATFTDSGAASFAQRFYRGSVGN